MATPRSTYYFGGSESVSVAGSGSSYSNYTSSSVTTSTPMSTTTKGFIYSRSQIDNTKPTVYNTKIDATYNVYSGGGNSGLGFGFGGGGGTRTIVKVIKVKPEVKKHYTDGSLLKKLPKPTKTEYVGLKGDKDMFGWSLLGNWLDWLEKHKTTITKQYVL